MTVGVPAWWPQLNEQTRQANADNLMSMCRSRRVRARSPRGRGFPAGFPAGNVGLTDSQISIICLPNGPGVQRRRPPRTGRPIVPRVARSHGAAVASRHSITARQFPSGLRPLQRRVGQPAVASLRDDLRTAPALHRPLIVAEFAMSVLRGARMLAPGSAFPRKRPGCARSPPSDRHHRHSRGSSAPSCHLSDTCSLDSVLRWSPLSASGSSAPGTPPRPLCPTAWASAAKPLGEAEYYQEDRSPLMHRGSEWSVGGFGRCKPELDGA